MINTNKPNLVFLGPPGAGKGSLAKEFCEKLNYFQLSTGDMFRTEIRNKTKLGLKIKSILDAGSYVSDEITNELVKKTLTSLVKKNIPFILDGYPRTILQADFLTNLAKEGIIIKNAILLEITEDQVVSRLSKRRVCPKCKRIYHIQLNPPKDLIHCDNEECDNIEVVKRPDDDKEIVEKRIKIYNDLTFPLIDYYEQKQVLIRIDAYQPIEKVFDDTIKKLDLEVK